MENGFDTRLKDLDRLYELGFIGLEERGIRIHEIFLQEIFDELDRLIQVAGHSEDFPLDK